MERVVFEKLLSSILQCVFDLWEAADGSAQRVLVLQRLEALSGQLQDLEGGEEDTVVGTTDSRSVNAIQEIAQPARDLLSVILSSAGLLENYEAKLSPERRAEEFEKMRTAVQKFACLLDQVTI